MTFVTELISKEDQERIGFDQIRDPMGRLVRPYKWTVDREKDAFLVRTYRGGEDSSHLQQFIFGVGDKRIKLQLSCQTYLTPDGEVYPWSLVHPIEIPRELETRRDELIAAIKAGLFSLSNSIVHADQVTFSF